MSLCTFPDGPRPPLEVEFAGTSSRASAARPGNHPIELYTQIKSVYVELQ